MLKAGSSGYLLKERAFEELVDVEPAGGFVGFLSVRVAPADDADAGFIDFCVEIEVTAALFG